MVRRLESVSDGLNRTLRPSAGGAPTVRWLERTGAKRQHVRLAAVPLDLAPVLRELLFDRLKTVALTSATLAAGGDFDFLESRLGPGGRAEPGHGAGNPARPRSIFPSQCLFGIPDDIPDPREDEHAHDAARGAGGQRPGPRVRRRDVRPLHQPCGAAAGGRASCTAPWARRWPLLVQGESPRDQLLRRFREAGNAILLGTDSFWEGVDVPGRALRALVLSKLPFKVPSEPITAARLERLAEQGEDGFMGYLLPHAALKLKQGFGRLIRSTVRCRRGGVAGPAGRHQALWTAGAFGAAPGRAGDRDLGAGADQV